jgi:hypoxanthine phosphoribosyltransferase
MILTHPSFDNIEHALKQMTDKLDKINFQPDLIVGLARGGLTPAVILSHSLNVKMAALFYSAKGGRGDDRNHDNKLPRYPGHKRILFVDDITDSGHTLKEVYDFYHDKYDIKTATLYHKEGSIIKPDITWWEIPKDSPFITFPWERNVKYLNY